MEKFLLYLSAFVPMYILLALKLVIDLTFGNLSFNVLNSMTLGLLVLLTGLGILGLVRAMKKIECHAQNVQIESATNCTDEQFFNYFSLFVLFHSPIKLSLSACFACLLQFSFSSDWFIFETIFSTSIHFSTFWDTVIMKSHSQHQATKPHKAQKYSIKANFSLANTAYVQIKK